MITLYVFYTPWGYWLTTFNHKGKYLDPKWWSWYDFLNVGIRYKAVSKIDNVHENPGMVR